MKEKMIIWIGALIFLVVSGFIGNWVLTNAIETSGEGLKDIKEMEMEAEERKEQRKELVYDQVGSVDYEIIPQDNYYRILTDEGKYKATFTNEKDNTVHLDTWEKVK